jgi:hypothetical protein
MKTNRFLPAVAIALATPLACLAQTQLDLRSQAKSGYDAVPFSATPSFTATGNNVTTFLLTLSADVTSSTLSGASVGQLLTFRICQDTAGAHAFVWPPNVFNGGGVNAGANTCTSQTFIFDGAAAQALGIAVVSGISGSAIAMPGSSSGVTTLQPAAAASGTLTLPARTATVATTSGSTPANDCAMFDASGNLVDSGGACGGGAAGGPAPLIAIWNASSTPSLNGGVTAFSPVAGITFIQLNESYVQVAFHRSGMAQNLCITTFATSQPATGSLVFVLRKNGVDTALTQTVPAGGAVGEYCDTTHTVAINPGDILDIKFVNNATSASTSWLYTYLEVR